ncbi:recombinase family protein [Streptomyces platensis]|uniref:recombinase family protein n=1 Tax=Streptomyces platensis TaxID=58346 RepID=UPI0036B53E54
MAIQYHTARFCLVPHLAKALSVPTPAVRKPGSAWTELPRPVSAGAKPVGHVRLGYARASTARQSLDAQIDSLAAAGVTRIFSEKISTRATKRPELETVVKLAGEIRSSGAAVTLVVHEHKRLGRGIELAMLAEELKASDVGLEFLTGELKGSHAPSGIVFTVLAARGLPSPPEPGGSRAGRAGDSAGAVLPQRGPLRRAPPAQGLPDARDCGPGNPGAGVGSTLSAPHAS